MNVIEKILSDDAQKFIHDHEHEDEKKLLLKYKEIFGIPFHHIAAQLNGRKKARTKIPTYYNQLGIIYPPVVNLEQSSSEETARYKSELISRINIADLTGGFGIDSYFFSRKAKQVFYIEPNTELFNIAKHNHSQLHATNIHHNNTTAEEFLNNTTDKLDVIYLDPSRRAQGNQRTHALADTEPNVLNLSEQLFNRANTIIIKASPMLDIPLVLSELNFVKDVHVVAVLNECKELLFICEKGYTGEATIHAINLKSNHPEFSFSFSEEKNAVAPFTEPDVYIYEPNAAILKAGAFRLIANRYQLNKLHPSTHLYTLATLKSDFPGRVFKIKSIIKPETVDLVLPDRKANVIVRNYSTSPDVLKKKLRIHDGGEDYVLAFSTPKKKHCVLATRVH